MIYFCEDCGEKNFLDPTQIKKGKAVFICSICDYSNAYRIEPVKKKSSAKKDTLLLEIVSCPEVIGSFFIHTKTGLLKNNMPDLLKKSDLETLGKILIKNYMLCKDQYHDINETTLVISNKNMTLKKINSDLFYIIACKEFPLSKGLTKKLDLLIENHPYKNG